MFSASKTVLWRRRKLPQGRISISDQAELGRTVCAAVTRESVSLGSVTRTPAFRSSLGKSCKAFHHWHSLKRPAIGHSTHGRRTEMVRWSVPAGLRLWKEWGLFPLWSYSAGQDNGDHTPRWACTFLVGTLMGVWRPEVRGNWISWYLLTRFAVKPITALKYLINVKWMKDFDKFYLLFHSLCPNWFFSS